MLALLGQCVDFQEKRLGVTRAHNFREGDV
jgi:hypothetical protein